MSKDKKSGVWVARITVSVTLAVVAVLGFFLIADPTPDSEQVKWKKSYRVCMADANNPSKPQIERDVMLKGVCHGLHDRYIEKYHDEP